MSRILIIEDYEPLACLLRMMLEGDGHDVETTANGRDGCERAEEWRPELVLLDTNLPDMDGHAVCGRLVADCGTGGAAVLMMTGRPIAGARMRALAAGAAGLLLKPFTGKQLLAEIARVLGGEDETSRGE